MLQYDNSFKKNNKILSYFDRFLNVSKKNGPDNLKISDIIKKAKKYKSEKKMSDYDKIAY